MEIRVFGLVLLLVMCAALPAESQTWEDFKEKHIRGRMAESDCEKVMNYLKIPGPDPNSNNCKKVNSFIVPTTDRLVKDVCMDAGTPVPERANLYRSNNHFRVVTCTGNENQRYPKCKYRGVSSMRKIVIGCRNNLPVHYQEGEIVAG